MKEYKKLTDSELCSLASSDAAACEFLLRKYSPLVKKITRSFFLIGAEPDDLIQEGMLGLHKAIMTFEGEKSSFTTYATYCIKNSARDAVKLANTKKNMPLNTSISLHQSSQEKEADFLIDLTSEIDSAEVTAMQKEDYKNLLEFINQNFSTTELAVLKLYLNGLSYSDIASETGLESKKVDNTIQKIKRKLQNNIKKW